MFRIRYCMLSGAVLLAGAAMAIPAAASAGELCSNGNGFGVLNRPAQASTPCRMARPVRIRTIMTYHWNGGRGATGGTIVLRQVATGRRFGPFAVNASSGQAGAPNVYWTAHIDLSLPSGDYEISDSDIATWSWNPQSGGDGIVVITGDVLATPSVAPGPAATAPAAPIATRPHGLHRKRKALHRLFG